MLTLTDTASSVVKAIVEQAPDTENAGLRINSQQEGSSELAVAVAEAPEPTDAVIEQAGARVFLDETALTVLDDKVLDAQVDPDGAVRFEVLKQG